MFPRGGRKDADTERVIKFSPVSLWERRVSWNSSVGNDARRSDDGRIRNETDGFLLPEPMDALIVVSLDLEEFFEGMWSEIFRFGLRHVNFQWWVILLDSSHHEFWVFVFIFAKSYFSYLVKLLRNVIYVLGSLTYRGNLIC